MHIDYVLGIISFITSVIAGVIGFGGGMLLIAVLPAFLSPSLIIPIHGITQLASNGSRMMFSLKYVQWSLLPKFLVGSLIGILCFGFILSTMPMHYVPIAIGIYI
uniref:TSUP family transporter n=1 Tax=Psychromonas sp. Urea-02u-13 TaxID=2058326 RepID=UPI000CC5ED20